MLLAASGAGSIKITSYLVLVALLFTLVPPCAGALLRFRPQGFIISSRSRPSISADLVMSASSSSAPVTPAGGKRPLRRVVPPPTCDNVRVYSISDLHCDYKRNLEWWYSWCDNLKASQGNSFNVVLIPGDVSSNMDTFRSTLVKAKESFDAVVIAIGNHDLWVSSTLSAIGIKTSLDKLEALRRMCLELDIMMDPICVMSPGGKRIFLAPLFSWYHASWDSDPDLPAEAVAVLYEGRPTFTDRWSDFRFCKWPEHVIRKSDFVSTTTTVTSLADHFAAMNDEILRDTDLSIEARLESDVVISLSHYVPRMELVPEKRFLIEPSLTKVIGSDPLERQVRQLEPALHVFGHTHIPIDMSVEGTRYLQWPLGSVAEQQRQTEEMAEKGPLLVYDELAGGLIKEVDTHWGKYYKANARDPLQCELAPWVLKFWGVKGQSLHSSLCNGDEHDSPAEKLYSNHA